MGLLSAYDPVSVRATRIGLLVVMAGSLLAFTILQLLQVIRPSITVRVSEQNVDMKLPVVLLESTAAAFNQSTVQLYSVYTGTNGIQYRTQLTGWSRRAVYGVDIIRGTDPDPDAIKRDNRGKIAWRVTPDPDYVFTPAAVPSTDEDIKIAQQLWIAINASDSVANLFTNAGVSVDVKLFPSANANTPLDIYAGGWLPPVQAIYRRNLALLYTEAQRVPFKGNLTSELTTYGVTYPLPNTISTDFLITVRPANTPSIGDGNLGKFVVNKNESVRGVTWLDFLSSVGGAISLLGGIYAFMFGASRLRPWGIVQRYLLRKQLMARMPTELISVRGEKRHMRELWERSQAGPGSSSATAIAAPSSRGMAEVTSPTSVVEWQLPQAPPGGNSDGMLLQRIAHLEARARMLEMHQDRVEIFYLEDDLFNRVDTDEMAVAPRR
ncbi:hypothetical protein THASP1DRAFT_27878 [Thamnocephalis sphaerospora]|uniref:Uncharacterized protein n=1 Tax=Thamnocephalis sphaerospora TaxID=78915 RepID=A0A4P9XVM3_9FUNG|nr:hypothetical protein THASP1DRAFT_27878 [Thamnocephalis sphaerospora]|eukprot:RKP10326.1 hypothetical protein THASP1DRAFT_27878 [Thamnocephalis sphaerospora]